MYFLHFLKKVHKASSDLVVLLTSQSQPVLLGLNEPPEHCDLHVQLHLDVLQVLVLLQLVGKLVKEALDLVVLKRKLKISLGRTKHEKNEQTLTE